jgi:hypothetical protein
VAGAGGIFLIREDETLVEMREQDYESEALLQQLLARHPDLLAGDQMDEAPRRWLLVAREMAIPGEEAGTGRWAVDHLFLDQDGVPTLVEVKRASDTRLRREVVGQMLDYAANAVVYWPPEELRARFEAGSRQREQDPDDQIRDLLGSESDAEAFWGQVRTNLQAGRVRLVFVADAIPPELLRIIEFLNGQMAPAEVLAVEVRQYVGAGLRTLVPRVVGRVATARRTRARSGRRQWDEATFLSELRAGRGEAEARAAQQIAEWAREKRLRIWWGRGLTNGSLFPMLDAPTGQSHFLFSVWTEGVIQVQFHQMKDRPPFDQEAKRRDLLGRVNAALGRAALPEDAIGRLPNFPLALLAEESALRAFLAAFDWVIAEISTPNAN